jgi:hypothetical protein
VRLTAPFLTAAAGRALLLEAAAARVVSAHVLVTAPHENSGPAAQQAAHLATAFRAERDGWFRDGLPTLEPATARLALVLIGGHVSFLLRRPLVFLHVIVRRGVESLLIGLS